MTFWQLHVVSKIFNLCMWSWSTNVTDRRTDDMWSQVQCCPGESVNGSPLSNLCYAFCWVTLSLLALRVIVCVIGPIAGNVSSSTIPEVHNLLQRCQRRTVPACRQRHKQTDRRTCWLQCSAPRTGHCSWSFFSLISGYDETAEDMDERDLNIFASESQSTELTATVTVQSINAGNSLSIHACT